MISIFLHYKESFFVKPNSLQEFFFPGPSGQFVLEHAEAVFEVVSADRHARASLTQCLNLVIQVQGFGLHGMHGLCAVQPAEEEDARE